MSISSVDTILVDLTVAGAPGGFTFIEMLLCSRPDFSFVPVTRIQWPNAYTGLTIRGLNQDANYFAKARAWTAGAVEDWSPTIGFRTLHVADRDISPAGVMIEPAFIVMPAPILRMTASSSLAGFPVENLLRDSPTAFRQVANDEGGNQFSGYLYFDVGMAPIDTIALLNTNLPEDAIISVSSGTNYPPTADITVHINAQPFRATANLPGRPGYHGLWRFVKTSHRYWRVDWRSSQQFVHIEHLVAGANRVTHNMALEKTETPTPLGTLERRRSGVADRVDGLQMRRVEFDLENLREAQYETVYADLAHKQNDPALVIPNSKSGAFFHDRFLYGAITAGRIVNSSSPIFTRSFTVDSII